MVSYLTCDRASEALRADGEPRISSVSRKLNIEPSYTRVTILRHRMVAALRRTR